MRIAIRLCFYALLFLALPFLARADNTSLSFGNTWAGASNSVICTSSFQGYFGNNPVILTSTTPSGPFSPIEVEPGELNYGGRPTICVQFNASTTGTYSGWVYTHWSNQYGDQYEADVYSTGHWFLSGFVKPKYQILGVTYAPPGAQSNTCYGSDTVVGNSTSVSSSFSNSTTQTVSVSFGGLINEKGTSSTTYTQELDSSSAVAVNQTASNNQCLNGFSDPSKGLNHDWDYVFVWLNSIAFFAVDPNSNTIIWTGYGFDDSDPTRPDLDVFGIPVGCLNGDFQISNPAEWSTCQSYVSGPSGPLARNWALTNTDGSGPGLTGFGTPCSPAPNPPTDFCTILAADQFGNSSFTFSPPPTGSNTTTDGRFTACSNTHCNTTIDYEPNITNNYMQGYSTTVTASQTAINKYSTTYSVDTTFKGTSWLAGLQASLSSSNTFTWTNQFSHSTNNSQGQMSSFKIVGPAPGYTGLSQFVVYQDNLYGTFMFNAQ